MIRVKGEVSRKLLTVSELERMLASLEWLSISMFLEYREVVREKPRNCDNDDAK